jgi:hypothetical protein
MRDPGRLLTFLEWKRQQNFNVPPPGPRPDDGAPFEVRRAWAMDYYRHRMATAQSPWEYEEAQRNWLTVTLTACPHIPTAQGETT